MIQYLKILIILFSLITNMIKANTLTINVKSYGAKANGINDDTPIFQKCIDLLKENKGGVLKVPKGIYLISHLTFFGKGYSNISIVGENATIKQLIKENRISVHNNIFKTFANRYSADGCFVFDAMVSDQKNDKNSIKNIEISGLKFISDVQNRGFDELLHQLSAHGVSNFMIRDCKFIGFLGDGIAINAGTDLNVKKYAYNKNVKIENCDFDGINKDNRQGISIYYCDGFIINKCNFKNITRTDMPGAIDIEPNEDTQVSRNGIISNCKFENIGGIASICIVLRKSLVENQFSNKNFVIEKCSFKNVNCSLSVIGNESYTSYDSNDNIVEMKNCSIENSNLLADLRSAYGVRFDRVNFKNIFSTTNNVVSDVGAKKITFKNCNFNIIANPNGLGFYGNTYEINFMNCTFSKFKANAITINDINGVGEITGNQFLSTYYSGGFPLITQMFSNKNSIIKSNIGGNISKGNFEPIDLNYFNKKN
jgi:Pectate lyase superfamily protein